MRRNPKFFTAVAFGVLIAAHPTLTWAQVGGTAGGAGSTAGAGGLSGGNVGGLNASGTGNVAVPAGTGLPVPGAGSAIPAGPGGTAVPTGAGMTTDPGASGNISAPALRGIAPVPNGGSAGTQSIAPINTNLPASSPTGASPVESLPINGGAPSINAIPTPGNVLPGSGLGSTDANKPLQPIAGEIDLAVNSTPVAVGAYIGVKIRISNNTNSPLLLDGDRAMLDKGGKTTNALANANVEFAADPPEPKGEIAKNGFLGAVTIGSYLAVKDHKMESGPVLGRFGGDEKRREASAERFGKRIVWTGDSTEGVVFFPTADVNDINGGSVKVPVCTFPGLDIRGYVSSNANGLQQPVIAKPSPVSDNPVTKLNSNDMAKQHFDMNKKKRPNTPTTKLDATDTPTQPIIPLPRLSPPR